MDNPSDMNNAPEPNHPSDMNHLADPNNPSGMNAPEVKKRFPWGWVAGGCAGVIVLLVAAVVVILTVVFPAFRNRIATRLPSLSPLQTPQPGLPVIPNPGSGNSYGNLPFKFSAVQDGSAIPDQSLFDQMTTALHLNTDTDFMAPKHYTGSATIDPSNGFTLGNAWCAKDSATLKQNLAAMQYQLSINGVAIDLSQYPTLYFSTNQGEACGMMGILITQSGTLSGTYHVVLTQKYLSAINDGITSKPYPAGDVTFDFTIQFHAAPSGGSKT